MWLSVIIFVTLVTSTTVIRVSPIANTSFTSNYEIEDSFVSFHRWKRQTNGPCVLPPYPKQGSYTVADLPDARPGQSMPYFVMEVVCRREYGIVESGNASLKLHCSGGEWSHAMPKCVRFCKLRPDPSITYTCHTLGQGLKTCKEFVPPGTNVTGKCNSEYVSSNEVQLMMCKNLGVWDHIAKCKVDCGTVSPQADLLAIGGRFAKFGEFPWHVGIYDKSADPYEQVCGGSIITNNVVISAAHCFWDDSIKQLPANMYAVATAKLNRQWDDENDIAVQKSDVKRIKLPTLFQGSSTRFQQDIAILFLTTPFVYKAYLKPVCYNYFNAAFEAQQLKKDNLGKVAGWGLIAANGESSPVLKVVEMPFVDEETCLKTVPASFKVYVSGDKFCAGYNGTGVSVCMGDSGGGLVFPDVERTIERYYLRGVVSASPRNNDKKCNDLIYSTFTKISAHDKFILDSITESTPKTCEWFLFQCDDRNCVEQSAECNGVNDCPDGSDESYELCTPGATTTTTTPAPPPVCILPPYPEHGTYEVANSADAAPGQTSDSFVMTVTCDQGYGVLSDEVIDETGTLDVYCFDGQMIPSMPQCVRFCSLPPDPSVRYMCQKPDSSEFLPCNGSVINGTTVQPICSAPDYYTSETLKNMNCLDNNLDYIPKCTPECGQIVSKNQKVAPDADFRSAARQGDASWYVSVFREDERTLPHCDGSIISRNAVITAAQTMKLNTNKKYLIVTGRHFENRDLRWGVTDPEEHTQQIAVKDIKFAGDKENIAILLLASDFVFSEFVRPVCLDFSNDYDDYEDEIGKVSVSLHGFNIGFSNINVFDMPVLYQATCERFYKRVPQLVKDMAGTDDLICVAYDGSEFQAVVGGGLTFPRKENGVIRYFLKAILSITGECQLYMKISIYCAFNANNVPYFAKISKHEQFIKQYL